MTMTVRRGGVYTPTDLHRSSRRLARVNMALAAMRRGQFLQLQYQAGRPLWSLSDGRSVSAEVAEILIKNARPSSRPAARCFLTCRPKPGASIPDFKHRAGAVLSAFKEGDQSNGRQEV